MPPLLQPCLQHWDELGSRTGKEQLDNRTSATCTTHCSPVHCTQSEKRSTYSGAEVNLVASHAPSAAMLPAICPKPGKEQLETHNSCPPAPSTAILPATWLHMGWEGPYSHQRRYQAGVLPCTLCCSLARKMLQHWEAAA